MVVKLQAILKWLPLQLRVIFGISSNNSKHLIRSEILISLLKMNTYFKKRPRTSIHNFEKSAIFNPMSPRKVL
jgi:hypothetical protein